MRALGGALGVAVAGTVVAMELRHHLPASWLEAHGAAHSILELGVQQIAQIPPDQHLVLMNAYRHAIATTFLTGAAIAAGAFTVVLFLPERPLRATRMQTTDD
jgi:hypothetical protein